MKKSNDTRVRILKSNQKFNISWIFGVTFLLFSAPSTSAEERKYSLTFYAGEMTSGEVLSPFSQNLQFLNTYILVGAISWTVKNFWNGALSLELEGNIGKYFGEQKNWEMNLALAGRWQIPWPKKIKKTLAWGLGPSYATEVPLKEVMINGASKQWLIYWFGEISLGLPKSNWAWILRLHHRSPGFGLFGTEGGANILCIGWKYYF